MKSHPNRILSGTLLVCLFALPAMAQVAQMAGPLIAADHTGTSQAGYSAAVSADGNTAILGAPSDNTNAGAAFVWVRTAGVWTEQAKLVGGGVVGAFAGQGTSVAITADGNTALVGGNYDNSGTGAVWVFRRSGTSWSQQAKLVGSGSVGIAFQGFSVAVSTDASVAVIGGSADGTFVGALWVFTQDTSSHVWTQQAKLTCAGAAGAAGCGGAVAVSPDGDVIAAGGYGDNSNAGAIWLFKRPAPTFSCTSQCGTVHAVIVRDPRINTWTAQGSKITGPVGSNLGYSLAISQISGSGYTLIAGAPHAQPSAAGVGAAYLYTLLPASPTPPPAATAQLTVGPSVHTLIGTGATLPSQQGSSVAITADGTQAFVGGNLDNAHAGGVWQFGLSGSTWSQVGSKLLGSGATGASNQGYGVAVSANGHVMVSGGPGDNAAIGAGWVFGLPLAPDLAPAFDPNHSVTLTRGGSGNVYYLQVANNGDGPTSGQVKVVFTLPPSLFASNLSGGGTWTCTLGTLTCTTTNVLAVGSQYPDEILLTVGVAGNAPSSLEVDATVSGGSEPAAASGNNLTKYFAFLPPVSDMTVKMSHVASFYAGQTGAIYTVRAHNAGMAGSSGPVSVAIFAGGAPLTFTNVSGAGWSCSLGGPGTADCNRGDALPSGASYPAIVVTVNVGAGASGTLTPGATVSNAGDINISNNSCSDPTLIGNGSDLTIYVSHAGTLTHGQTDAVYEIVVTNNGSVATTGKVTVTDLLPAGFTGTAMSGTGWWCASWSQTCLRTDPLAPGASYPTIRLTVTIGAGAAGTVTNTATVAGGGDANTGNNTSTETSGVS